MPEIDGARGSVDFYIDSDKKWAIELLVNGDRIGDHLARFQTGGRYETPFITDFCLLDFVPHGFQPKLLRKRVVVQLREDFSGAAVLISGGRVEVDFGGRWGG